MWRLTAWALSLCIAALWIWCGWVGVTYARSSDPLAGEVLQALGVSVVAPIFGLLIAVMLWMKRGAFQAWERRTLLVTALLGFVLVAVVIACDVFR